MQQVAAGLRIDALELRIGFEGFLRQEDVRAKIARGDDGPHQGVAFGARQGVVEADKAVGDEVFDDY